MEYRFLRLNKRLKIRLLSSHSTRRIAHAEDMSSDGGFLEKSAPE